MRCLPAVFIATIGVLSPVMAFEADTTAVLGRLKVGKLVPIAEIGKLMMQSERWCYLESDGACSWSDIYLEVTEAGASFEIGSAWDGDIDVQFVDSGVFKDGRYICETGGDWVPSVRVERRSDGSQIGGRELAAIKAQMSGGDGVIDCFDYVLEGSDAAAQTIVLLQRQYREDIHDPNRDVPVTLHFDAESAAGLTWY